MKAKVIAAILIVVIVVIVTYATGLLGKLVPGGQDLYSADFTTTPVSGQNLTVQFNSTVSGGVPPYRYIWDFGDDNLSASSNPQHTYASAGTYTVKLVVLDNANISRTVSKPVTVT